MKLWGIVGTLASVIWVILMVSPVYDSFSGFFVLFANDYYEPIRSGIRLTTFALLSVAIFAFYKANKSK